MALGVETSAMPPEVFLGVKVVRREPAKLLERVTRAA
jgi:hypothetical protein